MTIAVPTVVAGVWKLALIPLIETNKALKLKERSAWPRPITIIACQESRGAA
ncbi:MAG: hypothetical protein WA813_19230 [Beijerinckiaceae bacterium]